MDEALDAVTRRLAELSMQEFVSLTDLRVQLGHDVPLEDRLVADDLRVELAKGAASGSPNDRLHQYWAHGEGAAKIAWGTEGDFNRCVAELGKYIGDPKGYCATMHKRVTGMSTAQHAAKEKGKH